MKSIIVNGNNTFDEYGLLITAMEHVPPSPKYVYVDKPGGNGRFNLTRAVANDTFYDNQTFKFLMTQLVTAHSTPFEELKTRVKNALHGKEFDFKLSWDEGYTYRGWFTVTEHAVDKAKRQIIIEIDAEPYKTKGMKTYKLNANGGNIYRFECGRKTVQPVFECSNPTTVGFDGKEFTLPQGSYRCPDIWFTQGWNEVYLNSMRVDTVTWGDLVEGGEHAMTWGEINDLRWFEVSKLGLSSDDIVGMTWDTIRSFRWGELAQKTWTDVTYTDAGGRAFTTYVSYDWSDL